MNLQQLYYFKTIAEMEHYTRASEALNVSQSSLSHAIQSLEAELNIRLFARSGRNVALSKYGKLFLPYVNDALKSLEGGLLELRHAVDPSDGVVTVGCFSSLTEFVPDLFVRYVSETNRAGIRLQINPEGAYTALREQLLDGRADLVFATGIDDPRVGSAPIGEQGFVLLVPEGHRFATYPGIDLWEINGESFIAYSRDNQLRRLSDETFRRLGVRPKIVAEASQDVMIYGLVAAGRGIALTPPPLGGAPYRVRTIPVQGMNRRKLCLLWNKEGFLPPSAALFRDFIVSKGLVYDEYRKRTQKE